MEPEPRGRKVATVTKARRHAESLPGGALVKEVLANERDLGGGLIAGGVAFRIFLWIVPLGFTIFLPALYLLDKPDPLGMPGFSRFVAPAVAILFCAVAGFFWGVGVRRYRSTGS